MTKFLFRIEEELYRKVVEKAKNEGRSLNSHLVHLIERDINTVEIPVEGIVKDGKIKFNKYWNTPEGIEQSR